MRCGIAGCPGEYKDREIVHTVRHQGRVVVIDRVPAEVCPVCGDGLPRPDVVRRFEAPLRAPDAPASMAPLYEYARSA